MIIIKKDNNKIELLIKACNKNEFLNNYNEYSLDNYPYKIKIVSKDELINKLGVGTISKREGYIYDDFAFVKGDRWNVFKFKNNRYTMLEDIPFCKVYTELNKQWLLNIIDKMIIDGEIEVNPKVKRKAELTKKLTELIEKRGNTGNGTLRKCDIEYVTKDYLTKILPDIYGNILTICDDLAIYYLEEKDYWSVLKVSGDMWVECEIVDFFRLRDDYGEHYMLSYFERLYNKSVDDYKKGKAINILKFGFNYKPNLDIADNSPEYFKELFGGNYDYITLKAGCMCLYNPDAYGERIIMDYENGGIEIREKFVLVGFPDMEGNYTSLSDNFISYIKNLFSNTTKITNTYDSYFNLGLDKFEEQIVSIYIKAGQSPQIMCIPNDINYIENIIGIRLNTIKYNFNTKAIYSKEIDEKKIVLTQEGTYKRLSIDFFIVASRKCDDKLYSLSSSQIKSIMEEFKLQQENEIENKPMDKGMGMEMQ